MAQWPGKQIQRTQMFFTFKQKYPNIPDQIVSHCLATAGGDEKTTEELLESPEYSKYHMRKSNNVSLIDRSPQEVNAVVLPTPKTACSITRHVPSSLPKSPMTPLVTTPYNNSPQSLFNNFFSPNLEQPVANLGILNRIQRQRKNKMNLEVELEKHYEKREDLKRRIAELKLQLDANRASDKIELLTRQISTLRKDCEVLNADVDELCSVDGARGPIRKQTEVRITTSKGGKGISWGTEAWHCEMCTFRNHHLLNQCETCCMPRINAENGINAM